MLLRLFALLLALPAIRCQDPGPSFAIPEIWRSPASNKTVDESVALVNVAIDPLSPYITTKDGATDLDGFFQPIDRARAFSAVSIADYRAGTATHKDLVLTNFERAVTILGPLIDSDDNSVITTWGLAAMDAYSAYKDATALNIAMSVWERATEWFVTSEDAARGSHVQRNISIAHNCRDGSTAGGVFNWISNASDAEVGGVTVGTYLALSALLAEATADSKYATNAELSAQFIHDNLYNGVYINDSISTDTCSVTNTDKPFNTGYYLLGLSVLASKNSSWTPFLHSLIASTVALSAWTSPSGIDITGAPAGFSTRGPQDAYVRGLYEAWNRSTSGPEDMRNYMKGWINVQYNALLDLASLPGSNNYSQVWQGPPADGVDPYGQYVALNVLSAQIGFARDNGTSTTPSASQTQPASETHTAQPSASGTGSLPVNANSKSDVGAIAGGVIGGFTFLVATCLLWFVVRRRRRSQRTVPNTAPSPFRSSPSAAHYTNNRGRISREPSMSETEALQLRFPSSTAWLAEPNPSPAKERVPAGTTPQDDADTTLAQWQPSTEESHDTEVPRQSKPRRSSTAPVANMAQPSDSMPVAPGPVPNASEQPRNPYSVVLQEDMLDLAAVSQLQQQLSRIAARLLPGGSEEAPPRYSEA